MKHYQVLIKAYAAVVVIGAENEEKALEYAKDDISMGDLEFDEATVEHEIVGDQALESAKRHAQYISEE